MAIKLEMDDPTMPKDTVFDLGGIGIKNGQSIILTDEQEAAVVARHGQSAKEALGHSKFLKLSGASELSKKGINEILGGES